MRDLISELWGGLPAPGDYWQKDAANYLAL